MHEQGTPGWTLDDALLWLNDRRGRSVAVWVEVEEGDYASGVLSAEGELRHWSEGTTAVRATSREEIAGLYDVGEGSSFDLSNLRPIEVSASDDKLSIRLDERTTLLIEEQEDVPR
jgi:hypothetical protein